MKKILLLMLLSLLIASCTSSDKLSTEKSILSYKIEAAKNGLKKDIIGIINADFTITFDQEVPVTKDLIATFEGLGNVFIGDVQQISGVTPNRYDKPLEYTIVAEDGSSVVYNTSSTPMPHANLKEFSVTMMQENKSVDLLGQFSDNRETIILQPASNEWIENIEEMTVHFEVDGYLFVDEKELISGESTSDFRKEKVYTVKADDGTTKAYTVRLVSPQTSGIPVIKVDTEGGAPILDKENYVPANLQVFDTENPEFELEKSTGIRGRGNTSWQLNKKPYRIKFDKKTSMFGYGAAKSWVLLANHEDPTFIMNTVAFEIGHRLGLEFTNHANHVELFLNGKYKGSYVLTEQVQVNEHRINIDEEKDFLVELDAYFDEDYKFKTPRLQLPANIKSPELDNEAGMEFVKKAIIDLEDALFDPAKNFPNSNYAELIDVPTLINYLLANEIVRNREVYHPKSTYLYKKADGKIKMGPLWDFDWGFGFTGRGQTYFEDAEDIIFSEEIAKQSNAPGVQLFSRFFEDPAFRQAYKERWNEIKGSLLDIDVFIDDYGTRLALSAHENKEEWPHYRDYLPEIEKMKLWIKKRIAYLDTEFNK